MISQPPMNIIGSMKYAFFFSIFIFSSSLIRAERYLSVDTTLPVSNLNLFVSNEGSYANDGLSAESPKPTIADLGNLLSAISGDASSMNVLLERNSLFREEFTPVSKLKLSSFERRPGGKLPKITGMDVFRNWTASPGRAGLFEANVHHSIELSSPQYSYIMVAEIDTVLEKINPVTAVRYLELVNSIDAAASKAGTYYTADLTSNPARVVIHPTSGTPGESRYRYEVSTRRFNLNGYYTDDVTYRDLFLQTSGNGYGMLGGGDKTIAKNIIFQGGGTHHFVIKSGIIDSSVFLPGPKGLKDRVAAIYYDPQGVGNVNKLTNATFYDIPTTVYTHTNGSDNHHSFSIDKVFAFGDSTDARQGFSANDTDSLTITNSYTENYPTGFYGVAKNLQISKSIFRSTNQSAIEIIDPKRFASQIQLNNILIKTNGNDQNQNGDQGWVAYGVRSPYLNTSVTISNSIIHARSTWSKTTYPAVTLFQVNGMLNATKNIFICDVNDSRNVMITRADNSGGKGSSVNVNSDYNVFILLRGSSFHWQVEPNNDRESSILQLEQWQALTGQDKHSIILDLRSNPLGLKAIFVDPDNGNWSLSSGNLADRVRAVGAGMSEPPLFYPLRPIITPAPKFHEAEGFSGFRYVANNANSTTLNWNTYNENDIAYFEIENSTDSISFNVIDTLRAAYPGRNGSYSFNHQHGLNPRSYYRLKVVKSDLTSFYTKTEAVETIIRQGIFIAAYPNPVKTDITVEHPGRQIGNIEVFDTYGHWVRSVITKPGAVSTKLSLMDLSSGLYVIRWSSGKETASTIVMK
jgi:hypothetical protein